MNLEDIHEIVALVDREAILDRMVGTFRSWGAEYYLVGGLPLPGRRLDPLVLCDNWPDGPVEPEWSDPLLRTCLRSFRPFVWSRGTMAAKADHSALFGALGNLDTASIWAIPIHTLSPYQACVLLGGHGMATDMADMHVRCYVCERAFDHLVAVGHVEMHRPGELSARERSVIELAAQGRTANDIAEALQISQRTVHAHLHNASEKLSASNKTQTVVEAIRYSQIDF
ncbi:MAG TPA: LuxR C-terminal-related transcriptional regulator [Hyphomicrobiales bacterium]|nr:LuxR C-terminal-related transcriptional regulator [Kaistiaceae bacterium]HQF31064.1 LuxR C-terminal-related transcriptional regulator [Hyphomicrobiales bacterium]